MTGEMIKPRLKLLEEIGLSEDFIADKLAASFVARPRLIAVGRVSTGGEAVTSQILRIKVKWTAAGDNDKIETSDLAESFVLKVSFDHNVDTINGDESQTAEWLTENALRQLHLGEMAAYEWLRSAALENGLKLARDYYSQEIVSGESGHQPGLVILEDLAAGQMRGFLVKTTLTDGQAEQAIEQLAILHGWSLKQKEWRNDRRLTKNMQNLILDNGNWLLDAYKSSCRHLRVHFGSELGELADRLSDAFSDLSKDWAYIYGLNDRLNLPNVLCHGDFTHLHMMFSQEDKRNLVAVFDWKLIHIGCAAEDLVTLAVSSFSQNLRQNRLEEMLQMYRDKLGRVCQNCDTDQMGQILSNGDALRTAYHRSWKAVMLFIIPTFPYFLQKYSNNLPIQSNYVAKFKEIMQEFVDNLQNYGEFYANPNIDCKECEISESIEFEVEISHI